MGNKPAHIADIQGSVEELIRSLRIHDGRGGREIISELEDLSHVIQGLRAEMAATDAPKVTSQLIPSAFDELEAIAEATARATHAIKDSAGVIESCLPCFEDRCRSVLEEAVRKIFEACTFQDVTGRRVRKVTSALQIIEEKAEAVVAALGPTAGQSAAESQEIGQQTLGLEDEPRLFNAPQLTDRGSSAAGADVSLCETEIAHFGCVPPAAATRTPLQMRPRQ